MAWRYLASRLGGDGTETILEPDLPLAGASITKTVSGTDSLSGTISPAMLFAIAPDGMRVLEPWATALYACDEDDQIRGAGILTSRAVDGPKLGLTCVGFTGVLRKEPYTATPTFFVERDPIDIVRHIWDTFQALEGGNVGMVLDRKTMAGTLIGTELRQAEFDSQSGPATYESGPYKLADYLTDDLGAAIDSLATDYSFDYAESHAWNSTGDGFVHKLSFGAPRIGTRRSNLRFVVGENVITPPPEQYGADDYARNILVRGAGDGATMKRALVPRAGERRLRRTRIYTDSQLKTDAVIQARGRALLPLLTGSANVTDFVVRDHENAPIGSWIEGDEVELTTDTPWGETQMWVRVLTTTFSPENLGVAQVTVERADKMPS